MSKIISDEEINKILLSTPSYQHDYIIDQILSLIPDEEELAEKIADVRLEIKKLIKKLDDREDDLIEAKKQEREKIAKHLFYRDKELNHNIYQNKGQENWEVLSEETKNYFRKDADQILALIRNEEEKEQE